MKDRELAPFRLRRLLNPFHVARRLREMRDFGEFCRAVKNVFVYMDGRCRNSYYELRGALTRLRIRLAAAETPPPAAAAPAAPPPEDREALALLSADVVRGREALAERFNAGEPFRHVVIDGLLDPDFARALHAEFPAYDAARFRNEHGHPGKAHHENVAGLGPSYRKLDRLLQAPAFLRLVSSITGIPDLLHDPGYLGGGTHENLEDMELDPHVDFTVHQKSGLYRRVNLLLYLNPEWDDAWGGGLELHVNPWLPGAENPIRIVSPAFNRCVLFETSDRSWHGFRLIRLPEDKKGLTRRSFAAYLYTREKPRGFASIPGDLTVFVDRPLPPEIKPGLTLSERDVKGLGHLIVRRDWKLRYLYGRAIALYNEWHESRAQLGEAREALRRAEAEKAALANDLRLSRSQLREALEALLRAGQKKPGP